MLKIYYQEDCNLSLLEGKTIAVISYGSRGHIHALNLEESDCNIIVGPHEGGRSWGKTEEQDFEAHTATEATKKADVITVLINDEKQAAIYEESIAPSLRSGMMLMFAHGFTIHFGRIVPPKDMDATMITPKAPGYTVGSKYQRGRGTPCLTAVHQDVTGKITDMTLAYGQGAGGARADILETTFKVEAEADLFGEQAVLCGGVCTLMKAGFETLAEAGHVPENAYFGYVHEMKLIVDLIYENGFAGMRYSISNTAEYGNYVTGPKIVMDETKKAMEKILSDIQDGTFAKDWLTENRVGCPHFNAMRKSEAAQPLEKIGPKLRKLYSWNDTDKLISS